MVFLHPNKRYARFVRRGFGIPSGGVKRGWGFWSNIYETIAPMAKSFLTETAAPFISDFVAGAVEGEAKRNKLSEGMVSGIKSATKTGIEGAIKGLTNAGDSAIQKAIKKSKDSKVSTTAKKPTSKAKPTKKTAATTSDAQDSDDEYDPDLTASQRKTLAKRKKILGYGARPGLVKQTPKQRKEAKSIDDLVNHSPLVHGRGLRLLRQ